MQHVAAHDVRSSTQLVCGVSHDVQSTPTRNVANAEEEPFDFPFHTFYGTKDSRVTAHAMQGWRHFTTGAFSCDPINGNHLWPLDKAAKLQWLQRIVNKMQATL